MSSTTSFVRKYQQQFPSWENAINNFLCGKKPAIISFMGEDPQLKFIIFSGERLKLWASFFNCLYIFKKPRTVNSLIVAYSD